MRADAVEILRRTGWVLLEAGAIVAATAVVRWALGQDPWTIPSGLLAFWIVIYVGERNRWRDLTHRALDLAEFAAGRRR